MVSVKLEQIIQVILNDKTYEYWFIILIKIQIDC